LPKINTDLVRDYQTVLENAKNIQNGRDGAQVLDARPFARFTGEAPEPRAGLSSGHMPGSISVAFNEVVQSGQMLNDEQLRQVFESKGVDISKDIITSCGKYKANGLYNNKYLMFLHLCRKWYHCLNSVPGFRANWRSQIGCL
jgi:3-mercaptopyruvate sulfurtransferase SseA